MDRKSQLVNLTFRLSAAAGGRDWALLGRVDRELAGVLPRLAARGPWDALERQALQGLREAHRVAIELCERESAVVGKQLLEMCVNKEGWLAYASLGDDGAESKA